ncbi:hypothetical protein [Bradyrhizobium cytisi]|nr:hypothetical protein [Bradyrhizobium cytisi]
MRNHDSITPNQGAILDHAEYRVEPIHPKAMAVVLTTDEKA